MDTKEYNDNAPQNKSLESSAEEYTNNGSCRKEYDLSNTQH